MSDKFKWDAKFDVVVLGFGGAGATAARFAADNGVKVLLVDSAPEGHEGGNTRYAGQMVGAGENFDALKRYHLDMANPLKPDDDQFNNLIQGMTNMKSYFKKYLNVEPVSMGEMLAGTKFMTYVTEYPEYKDAKSYDVLLVHHGISDSALWKILRKNVLDRSNKITVWYESPAKHLIIENGVVIGVQIKRKGNIRNIRAVNGVVLSVGGFENNKAMLQDYLQSPYLAPIGTLYNKGDGIKLLQEAGARLWNMRSYESLGQLLGFSVRQKEGKRATNALELFWKNISVGSVLTIGDNGSRYFNEAELNRHGHINNHGNWDILLNQNKPYLIFDETKYTEIENDNTALPEYLKNIIKAPTIKELAEKINKDPVILEETISDFNYFATQGKDYAYHRDPKTLRKFDHGPYYAIPLRQNILNTQGGGKRNKNAQVLNSNNKPIPHLYEAGELGAPFVNEYTTGGNIADCLISGKIAGENAAKEKPELKQEKSHLLDADINKDFDASGDQEKEKYITGKNQYLGRSNEGMGDGVVVRTTLNNDGKIENIEILKQTESEDYGYKAVKEMPKKIIAANSYDVDAVSGASATSRAIKEAVKDSINKSKKNH